MDDASVEALGKRSEALETAERARGHLYAFHQLTGAADCKLKAAVAQLRTAGHTDEKGNREPWATTNCGPEPMVRLEEEVARRECPEIGSAAD